MGVQQQMLAWPHTCLCTQQIGDGPFAH